VAAPTAPTASSGSTAARAGARPPTRNPAEESRKPPPSRSQGEKRSETRLKMYEHKDTTPRNVAGTRPARRYDRANSRSSRGSTSGSTKKYRSLMPCPREASRRNRLGAIPAHCFTGGRRWSRSASSNIFQQ